MPDDTIIADDISAFPIGPTTVLLAAQDLAAILQEVRNLREEFEEFREQIAKDQAYDRRRIATLERGNIQPAQRDRGEVLKALLSANGGKMFAKDARQQMRLPENVFSELLKTQKDSIHARHFHLDRRRIVLELI